jgi:PIN domain nuclease of toxin-antitoxin system
VKLLLDTHILVWIATRDRKLTIPQRQALADAEHELCVSAVTAYEFTHLQNDCRLPLVEPFSAVQGLIGFELIDVPGSIWEITAGLPLIHRDPVDRMLVAPWLVDGMTILTADANIRRYPVPTI